VTGLIYVVIIALWAAVLIPMWLRRHDQISEVRSTARFSSAMHTLGGQGKQRSAEPARSGSRRPEVRMDSTARSSAARSQGMDPSYEVELARQSAATRRAVVLGLLTLVVAGLLLLAVSGMVPKWAPIAAVIPLAGFVVAVAMTRSSRSAARPARSTRATPARRDSRGVEDSPAPAPLAAVAPTTRVADDWDTWNAWDDEDGWDAVEATLPTYVSAPRASAVPRGIDRENEGNWSGEAMVETARALRARRRAEALARSAVPAADVTAEIPVVGGGMAEPQAATG
jgi:UPF0716 family protein affecting phage T7 exclusion